MPVASPALESLAALDVAPQRRWTLAEAQAYCRRFASRHAENFTVASWLLPRRLRPHFAAVYAWCRTADDLADEAGHPAESSRLLDRWGALLDDCYAGRPQHPIYVALAETIREFSIPCDLFTALLTAFRQDQQKTRYETFEELFAYCHCSADPVGRIVLHLGRCADKQNVELSDSICTGLQLVNFWQDVARDWRDRRRIYMPQATLRQFDADEQAIITGRATEGFRAALAWEVDRAEAMLQRGWPLVERVAPELCIEVELFIRGGLAVAAAIRRQRFDTLARRPRVGRGRKAWLLACAVARKCCGRPAGGRP